MHICIAVSPKEHELMKFYTLSTIYNFHNCLASHFDFGSLLRASLGKQKSEGLRGCIFPMCFFFAQESPRKLLNRPLRVTLCPHAKRWEANHSMTHDLYASEVDWKGTLKDGLKMLQTDNTILTIRLHFWAKEKQATNVNWPGIINTHTHTISLQQCLILLVSFLMPSSRVVNKINQVHSVQSSCSRAWRSHQGWETIVLGESKLN